ncbi:MAG: hypothetical protein KJO09_15040 [Gammaproteobacteria bacterium]|nr:hypothetical protein [Gammaproteobacteria bacterium]
MGAYRIRLAIFVAAIAVSPPSIASTCSCASVPLLGTMESASPNENQWFLATTYEFHDVSELVAGSSTIPDQTGRDRQSQALVFEISRGLTEKWSVSALLSAVEHEREISGQLDRASGVGDAVVMLKYSPASISVYSKNALSFGLGSRLPIGEDDARSQFTTLAEDLQPSTGAYAGLLWAYYARALNESAGAQVYVSASHTINGDNDRNYQFGDSTSVALGGSYQTQSPWGFGLEILYRHAKRDERNSVEIPNTGGDWLDIVPAVQYHATETLAVKASVKIPLTRDLNDSLQFTTRYAARLSLSYLFGE